MSTTESYLTLDSAVIAQRLRARIGKGELFALAMTIGLSAYFVYLAANHIYFPYDYLNYRNAAFGDLSFYYYAYWFLPIFRALAIFPDIVQLTLFFLVNIGGVWFACRVFGGKALVAVLSYQMLYSLYFGQMSGIIAGGLGLFWWGMANRRWNVAGLALVIACTKYQIGFPIALALWLIADLSWGERIRILLVPVIVFVVSLLIYGFWPRDVLERALITNPPVDLGSVSLWRWFGPLPLLLWIPAVLLPMSPTRRIIIVTATASLALPYFEQADLVALFMLPLGWWPLLANIGILFRFVQWTALQLVLIMPLALYIWVVGMAVWEKLRPVHPAVLNTTGDLKL